MALLKVIVDMLPVYKSNKPEISQGIVIIANGVWRSSRYRNNSKGYLHLQNQSL